VNWTLEIRAYYVARGERLRSIVGLQIVFLSTFKLLGLNFDARLSWSAHITFIAVKASKRLYSLKQLKRAGVPPQQLLRFCATVVRPVLEYCAPVWHYAITRSQAEQLESIRKRATRGMSYSNILFVAELTSLEYRRDQLSRSFFQDISHPSSSLYHLLPLHVIHLSCLGSEQPHGFGQFSRNFATRRGMS